MQRLSPIFLLQDMRRSFSPKFIEICMGTPQAPGDAMLVPIRMGTNMAAGNQQKHLLQKGKFISR